MHIIVLLFALFSFVLSAPSTSPVHVQIETDTTKSFHVGPYDRTRFDLIEQFHPLQTASIAQGERLQELRRRAEGVKSVQPDLHMVETSASAKEVEDGDDEMFTETPSPLRLVFGEWSHWTEWTPCMGSERSRMRACSSHRAALRIICHGEAKEVQSCFSMIEAQVPVAEDPWSIEREISGDFKI